MKRLVVEFIARVACVVTALAFDVGSFGERAVKNLNLTPTCAKMCILNPRRARIYVPEAANIPFRREYGKKLCENKVYQEKLDSCFKRKCSDENR